MRKREEEGGRGREEEGGERREDGGRRREEGEGSGRGRRKGEDAEGGVGGGSKPGPSLPPAFICLQYANTEGEA